MKSPQKQNPYVLLLATSWRFAGKHRPKFLLAQVMFVFASILEMLLPVLFALFINAIQAGGPDLLRKIIIYSAILFLEMPVWWLFHGSGRVIERNTSFHLTKSWQEYLYGAVISLPIKWHKDHHSGETIDRIKKASWAIADFSEGSFQYLYTLTNLIGSAIALLIIMPKFGLLTVLGGFIAISSVFLFDRILIKLYREVNEREHQVAATVQDYIANIFTVVTLRLEKLTQKEVTKKILHIFPPLHREIKLNELKWFSVSVAIALMDALIIFIYCWNRLSAGEVIMIGTLIMLYQYTQKIGGAFNNIASQWGRLVRFKANVLSVSDIIAEYEKLTRKRVFASLSADWQKIIITNLYFAYEDAKRKKHQLRNVSLRMHRGEKIAFVGQSGSGKSTMMTLLRGLYKPEQVELIIDGKKYNSLDPLVNVTTLIPQEPEIFENTIGYNVTMGIQTKKANIEDAVSQAAFDNVLARLPKGLRAHINERGVNLSGGEKQRLALARGIFAIKNSEIVLLDEPTSSVDIVNERKIHRNIFQKYPDKCVISSVHRLNILPMFDYVYVFSGGQIVQEGTFKELANQKGLFKEMWNEFQGEEDKQG